MNGQGQNPACQLFANRQVTLLSSEVGEAGLEMQGNRVVDCGADFGPIEMGLEPVPVIGLYHILVKDMPRSIDRGNRLAIQFGGFEKGTVVVGSLPPGLLESGQLRKLLEKKCGLNRVHPEIETHLVVEVFLSPMVAKATHPFGELPIPGRGESSITGSPKILGREAGETGGGSEGPAGPFLSDRPDCLGGVLENRDEPACGGGHGFRQGPDRRRAPEQVDRHDRCSLFGDLGDNGGGVKKTGFRIDIRKHGDGPDAGDRSGGGKEGECWNHDLISGAHPGGPQGKDQGVGSIGTGHDLAETEFSGQFFLEFRDFGPPDETAVVEHRSPLFEDLGATFLVEPIMNVEEGNGQGEEF